MRWDALAERFGPVHPDVVGAVVSVAVGPRDPRPGPSAVAALAAQPALVIVRAGVDVLEDGWWDLADVVVTDDAEHDAIVANVTEHPRAALALALLMRGAESRSLEAGLVAESMTYSLLQSGPEFAAWRHGRPASRRAPSDRPPVVVTRHDDVLAVTLDRPEVRNALDRRMRDGLLEALAVARYDDTIDRVEIRGNGPSYSSGGDLDEFGSFTDPASAHLVRLDRSIGRAIHAVRDRVVVHVHGDCYGSGVELPAFAGTVLAHPDTRFGLPELGLGLVPGAGGTVSVTARIGRHRTTALVLSGRTIDARTARSWGLVDGWSEPPDGAPPTDP